MKQSKEECFRQHCLVYTSILMLYRLNSGVGFNVIDVYVEVVSDADDLILLAPTRYSSEKMICVFIYLFIYFNIFIQDNKFSKAVFQLGPVWFYTIYTIQIIWQM